MPIDEFRNLESPEMKRQLDHGVRTPWSLHVLIAANILAWLATLANIRGIDLNDALEKKYGSGCPDCSQAPCVCDPAEKP